jgi:demethylmenaquinone methyltransferase/2-methoxy-6-polyprenyl-1,4-benzoquinol methylase
MSLGADRQFRYLAIKNLIPERKGASHLINWLDIGTGTGNLANELYRQKPRSSVVGIDVSRSMIIFSMRRKIYKNGLMNLILADAAKTPFRNNAFDGAFSGFVGRHFVNYSETLSEHNRIIRSKGRLMMLEMGRRATKLSFLIDIYVGRLMSVLGKLASFIITKGNAPFRLLEDTYAKFHSPEELKALFQKSGFQTRYKTGLLGSIVIMLGKRIP